MRILIFGSTFLTAKICELLKKSHHDMIGYYPSVSPMLPGSMPIPRLYKDPKDYQHDIKLSIQYDEKLDDIDNAFNVHTGLLPDWGGCDILYHTLKNKASHQGLTFHKMGKEFDFGPIIAQESFPVFSNDDEIKLYERMVAIAPHFVLSSLSILEKIGPLKANECISLKPNIFKRRVDVEERDMFHYRKMRLKMIDHFSEEKKSS